LIAHAGGIWIDEGDCDHGAGVVWWTPIQYHRETG
jgi:hypothetical protein